MLRKLVLVVLAAGLAAAPAFAKDKGKGKAKGKQKDKTTTVRVVETERRPTVVRTVTGDRVVLFADRDREVIRTYYVDTYGRAGCPPGLAKKNNGCLPPGQAKKRYVVGQRLPRTIVYQAAPTVLVQRLTPVPAGHQYVMVDGDVLMLATGTRLVVDAIRHLAN
jgi:Ni/Co efflux regulator RcnB